MTQKKIIVVSAINIHEGGMLKILEDCLEKLSQFDDNYRIIAIVHKKEFVKSKGIFSVELNDSRGSWFKRLYYEYFYFNKLSKRIKPYLWLSLHDITPSVSSVRQAVYCHNPSSFYRVSFKQICLDPLFLVYNQFYNFLYKKNISKNNFVIVQQNWIRETFHSLFQVDKSKIIVASPEATATDSAQAPQPLTTDKIVFFYPAFPRVFKNFETIIEASHILQQKTDKNYEVIVTLSGEENKYAKWLKNMYPHDTHVNFIGLQNRASIENIYEKCSCVIFPSELETWGLPITEAKNYNKPVLLADLPYAHETVGDYDKVRFFKSRDAQQLSELMLGVIEQNIAYDHTANTILEQPYTKGWNELFSVLLK
jgi:glycosyltransferase involved in cell wall biosynthesis